MPRTLSSFLTLWLTLTLTLMFPGTAETQQTGQLDPSFGSGGKVVVDWNVPNSTLEEAMAVATQSDGKMVVVGRVWTSATSMPDACTAGRILADGTVDTGFGTNGRVTVDFSPTYGSTYCNGVAIQSDGKILLAGAVQDGPANASDLMVARLQADGSLDTSFGSGGKVTLSYLSSAGSMEWVEDVLVQSGGKILLAGTIWWPGGSDHDFLTLRLLSNGSLDTSYGFSGYVTVAFDLATSKQDKLHAAALQGDGKLVLAGFAETGSGRDFAVVRLTAAGTLDPSFGVGGKDVIDFSSGQQASDMAHDVLIDASQRIVLAGETVTTGAPDRKFALARLTSSGSLDSGFSTDGRQTVTLPYPQGSRAYAVAEVANNKLVAVGEASYTTSDQDFAAVRLHDNGSLDTSFGSQGVALVPFDVGGNNADLASDVTVQVDGGIVMVGLVETTETAPLELDWGLAKLTGEPFFSFP